MKVYVMPMFYQLKTKILNNHQNGLQKSWVSSHCISFAIKKIK